MGGSRILSIKSWFFLLFCLFFILFTVDFYIFFEFYELAFPEILDFSFVFFFFGLIYEFSEFYLEPVHDSISFLDFRE